MKVRTTLAVCLLFAASVQHTAAQQPGGMVLASDNPQATLQDVSLLNDASLINKGETAAGCGCAGEACAVDCCPTNCCPAPLPCLTVYGGAMYWTRERGQDTQLMDDTPATTVLLRANQFDFDYELGGEFGAMCRLSDNLLIEGRYFQIDGWESTIAFDTDNGAFINYAPPGIPGDFGLGGPVSVTASYLSELSNVEINGRLRLHDRFTFIAGARYMSLQERLTMVLEGGAGQQLSNVVAMNDLFGPQIGADARLFDLGMLSANGVVKAAALTNSADNSILDTLNGGAPVSSFASKSRMAFLGEAEVSSTLKITHWLALTAGYQGMWLEGVALAPGQVPASNPGANGVGNVGTATVNMDGSLFYHGGFLRLVGTY